MRRIKYVLHGLVLGALVALGINVALANRNSGGTYSLPNPAVVTGSSISSTWANSTLNDLATEITNSLDRSGRGAMTGPLRLKSGASAAAPDLAWDVENNSGWYRSAAGDLRFSIAGVDQWKFTSLTATMPGTTPIILQHDVLGATAGVWFATAAPVITNYTLLGDTSNAYLNAPAGGTGHLRVGNVDIATWNGSAAVFGPATTVNGAFTMGSGGTAISQSNRGTIAWNPGTVVAQTQVTNAIAITGTVAGADCIAGVVDPAPLSGYPVQCITQTNVCNISIRNQQSVNFTFGLGTFYCRTFNP